MVTGSDARQGLHPAQNRMVADEPRATRTSAKGGDAPDVLEAELAGALDLDRDDG